MYQLVVFDWDGTLMDSAQKISNCLQAAARDTDLPSPSAQLAKSTIGLGLHDAISRMFNDIEAHKANEFIEAYRYHFVTADATEQGLFDGVEEGLKALNDAGVLLAVATGKARAGLTRVFKEVGLEHYFVATRCADETRSKPHPQMLLELLDYTAIDPINTIMVGDTTYDMEMASNAKVHGLGVSYGVHEEHDLRIAGAIEVLDSLPLVMQWLLNDRTEKAYA